MSFAFRVTNAVPACDIASLNSNLAAKAQFRNTPRLVIMNRFLPVNTTFTLEMAATSWLNVTDVVSGVVVQKNALEQPSFASAATTFETQRGEELVLVSTAEHECATAVDLSYLWTQVSGPTYHLPQTNREKVFAQSICFLFISVFTVLSTLFVHWCQGVKGAVSQIHALRTPLRSRSKRKL